MASRPSAASSSARTATEDDGGTPWKLLAGASALLFLVRLYAATTVGFGDSEALYACWAVHPQAAYLDHPGLLALVVRAVGEGGSPSPQRVHIVSSFVATLVPWLAFVTARAAGASRRPAAVAGLVLAVAPETAVGLFGMTPDLLLAPLWLGVLALAAVGLRSPAGSDRSATAFVGAGLLAGIAASAKLPGVLLLVALVLTYVVVARSSLPARAAVRTFWPWAGLVAGLLVFAPVVIYEALVGWPMLRHRLIDTQTGSETAFRHVGEVLGGQLVYVSPVLLLLAFVAARALVRARSKDAISTLLFLAFAVPFAPLLVFSLWSPVAEPHWIAPALLALPIAAALPATRAIASRRLVVSGLAVAALLTFGAHAWVLVPSSGRLLPKGTDPKLDISSELYGWPVAVAAVREQMKGASTSFDPEGDELVLVGPHWTVCAQLHALMRNVRVGCATPVPDDFDRWLPRDHWRKADHVLFVTDNRFGGNGEEQLPGHLRVAQSRVNILRAGRSARVFELYLYGRLASGEAPARGAPSVADGRGGMVVSPASRMSERSSSSSGFGVVRSFSP